MIRDKLRKLGKLIPNGAIRGFVKQVFQFVLYGGGGIIRTTDYTLFLKKLKRMQKQTAYSKYWADLEVWFFRDTWPERYERMLEFLDTKLVPLLNPNTILADMPCASGEFSLYLAKYVKSIDAFDLNRKMVDYAKNIARDNYINNVAFMQADATNIAFTKKYDVFMLSQLLMYIHDENIIDAMLKNVYSALNDDGILFICDPLYDTDDMYYMDLPKYYFSIWRNEEKYLKWFTNNKFEIIEKIEIERYDSGYHHICAILRKNKDNNYDRTSV
jgi:SAM-dependent methyltransferase